MENTPELQAYKFYPFKKVGYGEKMLKLTGQHILDAYKDLKATVNSNHISTDDDW